MQKTRRAFLKETLGGSLFLLGASVLGTPLLAFFRPDRTLAFLSPKEFSIMQAIAARIIGLSSASPLQPDEVSTRADAFLAAEPPEVQEQLHTLLNAFNAPFFTFLFDWRFSSFINMSPEDQDSYLEDWMTSSFAFRRTGFQALKRISLSMYYTDSRTWPGIGYTGMFMKE